MIGIVLGALIGPRRRAPTIFLQLAVAARYVAECALPHGGLGGLRQRRRRYSMFDVAFSVARDMIRSRR
ncbi:MAG: hypothetical protein OXC93_14520, partial [Rhodospirillaceae bacterium]|nr:hypothetical protein [Rhodospirillaceae bacterium]